MKKAYAVIGANFGDEGKGLMTDFFCRKNKRTVNVRFNGGAQAGHTVCTADGRRHIFSHLGAGFFAGADTYLSEFFTVNPMLFIKELSAVEKLCKNLPKVIVSKDCPVSVPCDILINQFAERLRGKSRHGSCGLGIYESIVRGSKEELKITFGEIQNTLSCRKSLWEKLRYINKTYAPERLGALGITDIPQELWELLESDILTENYLDDLFAMKDICLTADDSAAEEYDSAVFEGAQGLLLDMDRTEYFPNLTPSSTGMKNIRTILDRLKPCDTEVCYVTRSYFTRHGAGRFDTEDLELSEKHGLTDKTNSPNEFQGSFRYGYFDTKAFERSLSLDRKYIRSEDISVCVTHLDETDGVILCQNEKISPEDIRKAAYAGKLYRSFGETSEDVI